jgi:hypothetical protein
LIGNTSSFVEEHVYCTFKKYLFGLPSGRMTEIFAVLVHADMPDDSAETIFVPLGMTAKKQPHSVDE